MSPFRALRAAVRRARGAGDGEEGAALLTVLVLMFVVGALSVLVLGTMVAQLKPTQATQESSRTVFAAEAGVQTALSQIRSARAADGSSGDRQLLPCSASGSVDGTGGTVTFTATIDYYTANPTGKSDTWLGANKLGCTTPGGPDKAPTHAVVRAKGVDAAGGILVSGRQMQAVYTFNILNKNTPGGMLLTAHEVACLQAESAAAGKKIVYVAQEACTGQPLQTWVYDEYYHLVLASTVGAAGGALCITQPDLSATDRTVTLESCAAGSRTPSQLWGYGDLAQFKGQKADNSGPGENCLWSGRRSSPVGQWLRAGDPTSARDSCRGGDTDWGAFAPEPRVGAGAASMKTRQVVNFEEFGRCMDVTGFDLNAKYMIVYPCKQDPSTGMPYLSWNHKWLYGTETGSAAEPDGASAMSTRIRVIPPDGSTRCLTTPLSTDQPSYVVFRACDGSPSQTYQRTYNTGNLATGYLFKTSDGRCLGLGPQVSPSLTVSTIVAAPCTGESGQKWNAPPNAQDPSLTNQTEVTVGS